MSIGILNRSSALFFSVTISYFVVKKKTMNINTKIPRYIQCRTSNLKTVKPDENNNNVSRAAVFTFISTYFRYYQ